MQAPFHCQKPRKAAERSVDKPLRPSFGDIGEFCKCDSEEIEGQSHRLSVKISTLQMDARLREDEGIVVCRVDLNGHFVCDVRNGVARRSVHLRTTPDGIRVLDTLVAVSMGFAQFATFHQCPEIVGSVHLSNVGSHGMYARVK